MKIDAPSPKANHLCKSPCFILYSGKKIGQRWDLNETSLVLGSGDNSDIFIEEPSLLPEHAKVSQVSAGFVIEDLGPKPSIIINGKLIKEPTVFTDDAIIQIGEVILKFFKDLPQTSQFNQVIEAYSGANISNEDNNRTESVRNRPAITGLSLLTSSLALLAAAVYLAEIDPRSLVILTPLLFLCGTTIGLMLMAFPLNIHKIALKLMVTGSARNSQELLQVINYVQTLGKMGLVSGFLCFFIAIAVLFDRITSPAEIGFALANGILSLTYGFLVRMLAFAREEQLREIVVMLVSQNFDSSPLRPSNQTQKNRAA